MSPLTEIFHEMSVHIEKHRQLRQGPDHINIKEENAGKLTDPIGKKRIACVSEAV